MASFLSKWVLLAFSMSPVFSFATESSSSMQKIQCEGVFPADTINSEDLAVPFQGNWDNSLIKTGWEFIRPLYPLLTEKNNTAWVKHQEQSLNERYTDIQNFIAALPGTTKDMSQVTLQLSSVLHELEKRQREESMDLVKAQKRPFKNKDLWAYEKTLIQARQLLTAQALIMIQNLSASLLKQNMVFFRERSMGSLEQWRQETKNLLLPELTESIQRRLVLQRGFHTDLAAHILVMELKQDPGLQNFHLEIEQEMKDTITLSNLKSLQP